MDGGMHAMRTRHTTRVLPETLTGKRPLPSGERVAVQQPMHATEKEAISKTPTMWSTQTKTERSNTRPFWLGPKPQPIQRPARPPEKPSEKYIRERARSQREAPSETRGRILARERQDEWIAKEHNRIIAERQAHEKAHPLRPIQRPRKEDMPRPNTAPLPSISPEFNTWWASLSEQERESAFDKLYPGQHKHKRRAK